MRSNQKKIVWSTTPDGSFSQGIVTGKIDTGANSLQRNAPTQSIKSYPFCSEFFVLAVIFATVLPSHIQQSHVA